MTTPLISFIIPNYNGKRFLDDCLKSIFKEKNNLYEVILIDDCSEDDDVAYIRKKFSHFKKLRLIALDKHVGTVRACRAGVNESRGKYMFILNNDTIIKPGFTQPIREFFEKHKKAAVAQAKIMRVHTNNFDYAGDNLSTLGFLVERARSAEDRGQFDEVTQVFSVKGTAMIVRKNVYQKLGGFDEDYTFGWEEPDFTWRAWLSGYETYFLPYVTVYHFYGTKKKTLSYYIKSQIFFHGCKGNITTLIKNLGPGRLAYMLPLNVMCYFSLAAMFLIKMDFNKSISLLRGIGAAFLHLPRTLKKRRRIQSTRKISDDELFALVGIQRSPSYYLGKAWAYVRGKPY